MHTSNWMVFSFSFLTINTADSHRRHQSYELCYWTKSVKLLTQDLYFRLSRLPMLHINIYNIFWLFFSFSFAASIFAQPFIMFKRSLPKSNTSRSNPESFHQFGQSRTWRCTVSLNKQTKKTHKQIVAPRNTVVNWRTNVATCGLVTSGLSHMSINQDSLSGTVLTVQLAPCRYSILNYHIDRDKYEVTAQPIETLNIQSVSYDSWGDERVLLCDPSCLGSRAGLHPGLIKKKPTNKTLTATDNLATN